MEHKTKAPTPLKRLAELVEHQTQVDADSGVVEDKQVLEWLQYILESLTERKLYHKKQQLKRKMMVKVASEHLTPDELEAIDRQAEEIVAKQLDSLEKETLSNAADD